MADLQTSWWTRHKTLVTRAAVVLAFVVIAIESILLALQASSNRAAEQQSAKLLTAFLARDTVVASGMVGVPIRLQNVRFVWSDKVFVDVASLAVRAMPLEGTAVDFDRPESFLMSMQQSEVRIRPSVLEGMFNESIFNYPGSKLRDLKVTIKESDGERLIHLSGNAKVLMWVPFKMDMRLSVDKKTNTLVLESAHTTLLGILPVVKLMKLEPLQMEHVISLPPNNSLMVVDNRIMLKPFSLFPPPRINGKIAGVTIEQDRIRLEFSGAPIAAPVSKATNYVYLKGGAGKFGSYRMDPTDILIVDQSPGDLFSFSMKDYATMIPRSQVEMSDLRSVRITMPDYRIGTVALAKSK